MKRLISSLLIAVLLLTLSACTAAEPDQIGKTVSFYYCTNPINYNAENGVITPEVRKTEGYTSSFEFLLNLYLNGPVGEGFSSPFPDGLYAESITKSNNRIMISLSSIFSELNGLDLTLACVCLSKTAQELAQVDYVYISYEDSTSGKRHSITVGPDSFLLTDESVNIIDSEE